MLPGVGSQLGGYLPSPFGSSSGATSAVGGLFGQLQSAPGRIPPVGLFSAFGPAAFLVYMAWLARADRDERDPAEAGPGGIE